MTANVDDGAGEHGDARRADCCADERESTAQVNVVIIIITNPVTDGPA